MKVIYQKTIVQQVYEAARDAMIAQKRIEKILLSHNEVERLKDELAATTLAFGRPSEWYLPGALPKDCKVCGIPVERDPSN